MKGFGHAAVPRSGRNLFHRIREDILTAVQANPSFELFLTGYSLGSVIAAVLTLIMRDDSAFLPALAFCFALLPFLTHELAERTAEFAITLINGPEIVPRFSDAMPLSYFATERYVADPGPIWKAALSLGLQR